MKVFPKPLSSEDEKMYLQRWMDGDEEARNILIEHNLRLVAHVLKKYMYADAENDDLLSIGTIGLIKAVNTYNPQKANRLATYAGRCIENEILMYFRTEKKTNREVSLYEPIGTDKEGNEINLIDIIEAEEDDIIQKIELRENTDKLYIYMNQCLTEREKEILCMRYGLYGNRGATQREIADMEKISRSYVSRIEKKAVRKLRDCFEKEKKMKYI